MEHLKEIEGWDEVSGLLSQWSDCATEFECFALEQEAELDNIIDRLEKHSIGVSQLQEESQRTQEEVNNSQHAASEATQRAEELEKQLQELESAHNEIVDEAEERLQQLSNENSQLSEQRNELETEVTQLREYAEQFEAKLAELEAARGELETVKQKVTQQQAELAKAEFGTRDSNEHLNELEQEVTDLRLELEESRKRTSRYKDQLAEERAEWHTELKLLRKAIESNAPDDGSLPSAREGSTAARTTQGSDRVVDRLAKQFKRLNTPDKPGS